MRNYIILTDHSIYRGYDRLFKNSDELLDMSNLAYVSGLKKSDIKGKLLNYLRAKSKKYNGVDYRIYNGYIWIYSSDLGQDDVDGVPIKKLITFYKVPKQYNNIDIYLRTNIPYLKITDKK